MQRQHKSILIVDDLKDWAMLLSGLLGSRGYDTIHAFDYDQAIHIVNERDFDCALLDYSLGDEKHTGIDIAEHIRKINKRTRIILMSGEPDEKVIDHIKSFLGITLDHYIRKPFSVNDVTEYI